MDIPRAAYNFRKFAHAWQVRSSSYNQQQNNTLHVTQSLVDTSQSSPGVVNLSSRRPLGVAGLISPWNLPLYLLTFKVAPAIMAGNTVVCKPRCRH